MSPSARSVPLLFTDIEGSTRLLQRLGQAYRQVLDDHFGLIFDAIGRASGTIVNTMGDGLFATFAAAPQAVEAALNSQRALVAHKWPTAGMVRVRMGIHVGVFAADDAQYVGLDVHRAARICGAAHGGQVLISAATARLCARHLAPDVAMCDLGRHRLKDIDEPEHLFQATVPGLLAEFPPPRSPHVRPHNLPSEVTDFVGRARELDEIKRLLGTTRLLTLTGSGGTGKTRLALRIANQVLPEFEGGVYFVPLDSVRDPQLVGAAIGRALGLNETDNRPILDIVIENLAPKKLLLVLDNFEQVLGAAPTVARLLAACAELKILITSRALLHIGGERMFEVVPLDVPPAQGVADLGRLAAISGVDLFVRRAGAVRPGFVLTPDNAAAVAEIVTRLEGLPLAIELAAVRTRLFPPEMLAKRLDQRLKTLSSGLRDSPAHHGALRDMIAWSYDLLDPGEQTVFRRLGIFVGGFTVEAAEVVAAGEPSSEVIERVSSLLDKSLIRSRVLHGEARLSMLETIREFALEKLDAADERGRIAALHVEFVHQLAQDAEGPLAGRAQLVAVDKLAADQANIRAALRMCLDNREVDTGLAISGAIWRFWHATGQIGEGRQWLTSLLALPGTSPLVRAKGLIGLAGLAYWHADYPAALTAYREALELYRKCGDRLMEADVLYSMSTTLTWSGDAVAGGRLADQALAMFDELGARDKVGEALMAQGFARWMKGDLAAARRLWEASFAVARETGDDVEAATKLLALASIKFRQGEENQALTDASSALQELFELKHVTYTIMALDFVAALAARRAPEESVRLAAAAARLRAALGGGMRPEASGLESARTVAGRVLDAATIGYLWTQGENMKLEEAVAAALKLGDTVRKVATAR